MVRREGDGEERDGKGGREGEVEAVEGRKGKPVLIGITIEACCLSGASFFYFDEVAQV